MTINIFLNIFFIAKIKLLNFFNSDDRKAKVYFSLFEKIDQNVKEDVDRQNNGIFTQPRTLPTKIREASNSVFHEFPTIGKRCKSGK